MAVARKVLRESRSLEFGPQVLILALSFFVSPTPPTGRRAVPDLGP